MPDLDGHQVLAQLQQQHGTQLAKTVAISASVLDHERQRCLDESFDGFIAKPFQAEEVFACLAELLGVEFIYEEEGQSASAEAAPEDSSFTLPADVLAQLQEAVKINNATELEKLLGEIETLDDRGAELAAQLRELVRQYDMRGVRALVEQIETS